MEEKKEAYIIPVNVRKTAFLDFPLFEGMGLEEIKILVLSIVIGIVIFNILKAYSLIAAFFLPIAVIGLTIITIKPSPMSDISIYKEMKQNLKYNKGQKLYKYKQI